MGGSLKTTCPAGPIQQNEHGLQPPGVLPTLIGDYAERNRDVPKDDEGSGASRDLTVDDGHETMLLTVTIGLPTVPYFPGSPVF